MNRQQLWKDLDNFKRVIYIKYELKKLVLLSVEKNKHTLYEVNIYTKYKLLELPNIQLQIKQNNRCVQSGRYFSVTKYLRLSRFFFRYNIRKHLLLGWKRTNT